MDTQGGRASFGFSSTDPLRSATSFKVNEWPGRKRMKFVSWCYWRPPFWFPVEKKQRWTSQIFGILPITIIYMFSKVGGWFSVKNRCAHLELSKIERWSKSLKSIWWPGFLPFICSKPGGSNTMLRAPGASNSTSLLCGKPSSTASPQRWFGWWV